MLATASWQPAMLKDLQTQLATDNNVLALVLLGSLSQTNLKIDAWSDIDLLLIVADDAVANFYPDVAWLENFGKLYTYEQSQSEFWSVTRACFIDLRRVDFVISATSKFQQAEKWETAKFWQSSKIIFSKIDWLQSILNRRFPPSPSPLVTSSQFENLANSFWFKAVLAVNKVKREDLLIALHLALDLQRDCLLLAMWLRDRATGTTYHRSGGVYNEIVAALDISDFPYTQIGILQSIAHTAEVFDELALQWSPEYQAHRHPLTELIAFTLASF